MLFSVTDKKICVFHSGPEKLKKVQAKKFVKSSKSKNFFCENAFLAVLNFFQFKN